MSQADTDLAMALAEHIRNQARRPEDGLPEFNIATMMRMLISRIEKLEREVAALKRPPQG